MRWLWVLESGPRVSQQALVADFEAVRSRVSPVRSGLCPQSTGIRGSHSTKW